MLYNCFRGVMMFCAVMGIAYMASQHDFTYIIFPITILIWGAFTFFDAEDREYMRRNGIDPDEYSLLFPDYGYYGSDGTYSANSTHHRTTTYNTNNNNNNDNSRYAPNTSYLLEYKRQQYKDVSKKCKRNFKITLENE